MDRKVFTAILLSVVIVALVYLAFRLFQPFLLSILWAAVFAAVTHRGYERLVARFGGRANLAAFVMTFLVFGLVVAPFVLLLVVVVGDAVTWVDSGGLTNLLKDAMATAPAVWARDQIEQRLDEPDVAEKFVALARERVMAIAQGILGTIAAIGGLLWGVVLMLLTLFFFYRDGPNIMRAFREMIPMADEERSEIVADVNGAIQAAVRGGLLVALVQGTLGFVILLILGIDRPALAAAAMALVSFIPLVGTMLVWAPIALYLWLVEGSVAKALVLTGYSLIIIGGSDNVVRPIFLGRHMEAHPLLLFLGVVGGIALFGFAGIVLGPITVAFLNVAARLLRRRFAAPTG
jgi:predicted PurR-regulated permease PerM